MKAVFSRSSGKVRLGTQTPGGGAWICAGLGLGMSVSVAVAGGPRLDPRATAVVVGDPRVHLPFAIEFGFFNDSFTNARNVRVTNALPSNLQVLALTSLVAGASCQIAGAEIVCGFDLTAPGASALARVVVLATSAGFSSNLTVLSRLVPDLNPTNNTLAIPVVVGPPIAHITGRSVAEGPARVEVAEVWLESSNSVPALVRYQTADGSAVDGRNYRASTGTLVFPPGVTRQPIPVDLIENAFDELQLEFFVGLTEGVNVELAANDSLARVVIQDNDPPPVLDVLDTSFPEGDAPAVVRDLTFTLSTTSAIPVVAYFLVTDVSGPVPEPQPGSSYVLFQPGEARVSVPGLTVHGNTTSEPDKVYRVVLGQMSGATRARAEGRVTILNDDAVPGRVDHFVFQPIAAFKVAGRPFPIEVRAVDAFGDLVSSFAGPVTIQSTFPSIPVTPNVLSNFVGGVWAGSVAVSGLSTNLSLYVDDGAGHVGRSVSFVAGSLPATLKLPTQVIEGSGLLSAVGQIVTGFPYHEDIDFAITAPCCTPVPVGPPQLQVPQSVRLPAGQTNVTFDLTVLDDHLRNGTRFVTVAAEAAGLLVRSRSVRIDDNEAATLRLTLEKSNVVEGERLVGFRIEVEPPPDANVLVNLVSSGSNQVQLSGSLTLRAGTNAVQGTFNVVDDKLLQGPRAIELQAQVANWTSGVARLSIADDEIPSLAVRNHLQTTFWEGRGPYTNSLVVTAGGTLTSNLTVRLRSSDPGELSVPDSVVIPAGQSSAPLAVAIGDDLEADGAQIVRISAEAEGVGGGELAVAVKDNEAARLELSLSSAAKLAGVPFTVTVYPRNVDNEGVGMPTNTPLRLAASRADGSRFPITPEEVGAELDDIVFGNPPLASGWFPRITALGWGGNIVLTATTPNGLAASSAPLVVGPPPWSGSLRLNLPERAGTNVDLSFAARPGFRYLVERATGLPTSAWAEVGGVVTATNDLQRVTDRGAPARPHSFYRLSIRP